MKKTRIFLSLLMALTILCGSALTAFASETVETEETTETEKIVSEENNIFYEGTPEVDENGNYKYFYHQYRYLTNGISVVINYEFTTSSPVCLVMGDLHESDKNIYTQYIFTDSVLESGVFNQIFTVNYTVREQIHTDNNGVVTTGDPYGLNVKLYQLMNGCEVSSDSFATNIPVFGVEENAINYLENGDDSGVINKAPLTDDDMIYNSNIPTPQLVFANDGGLTFGFNNASDNYYIEMRGRWWSVDDITLFKKNLMWKYSYESLIKNDLSSWIDAGAFVGSDGEHDLAVYGADSFDSLLTTYPVDDRTYLGGSNALGNYFSGYNDGLSTLKMLLRECTSSYNSAEIYVRYYTKDESGNYIYGKWCHWLGNLANQAESSGTVLDDDNIYKGNQSEIGLTDDDLKILEDSGNSRIDIDLKEETYGEYTDPITGMSNSNLLGYFQQAIDIISGMGNMLGEFPALVGKIASFLPSWVIVCIGVGIVLCIILRVAGR